MIKPLVFELIWTSSTEVLKSIDGHYCYTLFGSDESCFIYHQSFRDTWKTFMDSFNIFVLPIQSISTRCCTRSIFAILTTVCPHFRAFSTCCSHLPRVGIKTGDELLHWELLRCLSARIDFLSVAAEVQIKQFPSRICMFVPIGRSCNRNLWSKMMSRHFTHY